MFDTAQIIAAGARTPVGLNSSSSAAAIRAGISGAGKHPFLLDQAGVPMQVSFDKKLDLRTMGPNRLLKLAHNPLQEACSVLNRLRHTKLKMPVLLALPEFRPGFSEKDAIKIRQGIENFNDLPIDISNIEVFPNGHAVGLSILEQACEKIRRGSLEACIVGGIESYFHPDTMEWLDENRQLVGSVSRSAFVPGEGAGFCLLMSARAAKQYQLSSLANILAGATAQETIPIKSPGVNLGEGLTTAIKNTVAKLSGAPINSIICDINGERYRSEEWGFVCLRLSQHFDDPTTYISPADCWGDMGAASAPLFAMIACQASMRGYAKGRRTILWAGSEKGLRASVVMETIV